MLTVDPFTGTQETVLLPAFGDETADVAMHPNGTLYSYRLSRNEPFPCYPRDPASGNYLQISPANGSATFVRDDGIETYVEDPLNPGESVSSSICPGDGIEFNAITIVNNQDGLAVGERGYAPNPNLLDGVEIIENILYRFVADPTSANQGEAVSTPQTDKADTPTESIFTGAGTQIRERGEVLTAPRLEAHLRLRRTAASPRPPPTRPAQQNIQDGQYFTVMDGANQTTFEFDTGPEITQAINVAADVSIRDGNFFQLDNHIFQMDVGSVIEVFGSGRHGGRCGGDGQRRRDQPQL